MSPLTLDDVPEDVRAAVYEHVFSHGDVKVGGVLVGNVDDAGRAMIHAMVPALLARTSSAGLTFTHDAWGQIIEAQERDFPDSPLIVGWYHSRPGMGNFLSDLDLFIHENFFREPFQVAWIIDPQEESEGLFGWEAAGSTVVEVASRTPRRLGTLAGAGVRDLHDAFISHASEDKAAVARPLAEELKGRGRSVWFADYELLAGDSLSRRIDEGLRDSTVGVVILSESFFRKEWPRRELDGLTARRVAGEENVIVPVWHGVTLNQVRAFSPPLADLKAPDTKHGITVVADEIERLLNRMARVRSGPGVAP